jgi:hypothetical protein
MFRGTLLGKSPFLATLFEKCSVDQCSEVISNPISAKECLRDIHCL